MPFTFTVYRSTDTDATGANSNSIYASPFTINGGATTHTITISDDSPGENVLGGDGSSDSPTDPDQVLLTTTEPGGVVGGHIIYEAVVTFDGSDGNEYTAIIFDYDEDDSGQIQNNNSGGTNSLGNFEEGFFIAFIPNGFDPALVNFEAIEAGPVPPPGTTLTRTAEVSNAALLNIVCFTAETNIETPEGDILVKDLHPGDLVNTLDNQIQPICRVYSRKVTAAEMAQEPKLKPVRITAGALGQNLPTRDLLVSRQHRMMVSSRIAERVCNSHDVLVSAIKLTELPGIFIDDTPEDIVYYHVLLDHHEVIYAEGAPTESLYTGAQALKALAPEAREEIMMLFPELSDVEYTPAPALPMPDGKTQKKLVARHLKNTKPVLVDAH